IKYDLAILEKNGFTLKGELFDTMIASYLLDPDRNQNSLDALAHTVLNRKMISYKDVCGTGQKEISFAEVEIPVASEYSVEDAEVTYCLYEKLFPLLQNDSKSYKIFREIEIPLLLVIKTIEEKGVKIDTERFSRLSKKLEEESNICVMQISEMIGGEEVNLNSPKQLSEILFEKIGLKPIKKTKTGFSTDISVLEKLAEIHPLPAKILEYRQYEKLKNTYVDKLPKLISPNTGRIHTSFNQTIAATGRLSSNNPNLQNIPVRSEAGKEIRKGFIPEKGFTMIAADYSQIELRLLAHFSKDKSLIQAFCDGRDIHRETAARLNNVMLELVTDEMRSMAKAVNFGIIYGQTPFGLSKQLKISMKDAKNFIDNYFLLFPGILKFMSETIEVARDLGYSETYYGRKRYIHDINSPNKNLREYAERTAVNSTIQGTAADIIKVAMINIQRKIEEENLSGRMILQVHDELVFEVDSGSLSTFFPLIKNEMENVLKLSVPLTVDINTGSNWQAAKS
ncbi:MAG: DNA polymerase I, partial [Nitrospinae bacterium]|nr:DNA polymerase I [Nitrospinota bacterium]